MSVVILNEKKENKSPTSRSISNSRLFQGGSSNLASAIVFHVSFPSELDKRMRNDAKAVLMWNDVES